MKKEKDSERKQEELTWLESLQRNSWEPEIIISGITLAFLFAFPAKIYEFSAYLIQEIGIAYLLSSLVLFYLTSIVSVFKIFFVFHLFLRFVWAGLLGLSYAFPQGVIDEKLFKSAQGYRYQNPANMALKLERVCSMTFAYPVSLVISIFIFTLYLGLLLGLYFLLNLNLFVVTLILVFSLILTFAFIAGTKKNSFKRWYSESLLSSVSAVYQSNLGKWFTVLYSFLIIALATPVIISDITDFSMFRNEVNLRQLEVDWPAKYMYFETELEEGARFPRVFIPEEVVSDNYLLLGIARYEEDKSIIEDLKRSFKSATDSLSWGKVNESADLHRVYIDGKLIETEKWSKHRLKNSGQKVYQSAIDIKNLKDGVHEIRVEKMMLVYAFIDNEAELQVLSNWAKFHFIKK